ncbi:MAG TPA: hypothetical protein VM142_09880 [Acidimicrobiales bacterium]|nr:hypothetical protein [Acidimicrobiales bacterium]
MSGALLDDHLLRDMLADDLSDHLAAILAEYEPATTNYYYLRLCKSVVSARGGRLTGTWPVERRRALGRTLMALPRAIEIAPLRPLAFAMAEIADAHRVSALGAEAVAAAVHLGAPLCVWEGNDGPGIRAAMDAAGADYRTIAR